MESISRECRELVERQRGNGERKAAFNAAVDKTLNGALAISNQRGGEYSDSWALENQQTRFLDMVLREIEQVADRQARGTWTKFTELGADEKRLIMVACLCDVKLSRLLGGYKEDTLDDLINYVAALRAWMDDYIGEQRFAPLEQTTRGAA